MSWIDDEIKRTDTRLAETGNALDNYVPQFDGQVETIARLDNADKNSSEWDADDITPFADPFSVGVGDMLDTEPPERRWLLNDLLPLGVVGMLAAGGGTGKSFITKQMGISVATGRPFLGIGVGEPGGVLMIAAEDEREESHRRLWRIVRQMKADGDLNDADIELIRERLFIAPCVGQDNRLTAEYERMMVRTVTGKRIEALVNQLPTINLIILDPVSRFRGGDENANEAATRFVESVETLRAATGATILLPHHVNKGSLTAGAEGLSIEGLRGASALVDGVRWAAAMATMRKDEANQFGIDREDAGHYVRLDAVKNNYAAPWSGQWLKRLPGGVLVPVSLEKQSSDAKTARKAAEAEDLFQEIVKTIKDKVREAQEKGEPITVNQLRKYAGVGGIFNVGDHRLRGMINRAIDESHIALHKPEGAKYSVLKTWK